MVFRKHFAGNKLTAIRMRLENRSRTTICNTLGVSISKQSLRRWMQLYRTTQRVVRDPKEYERQGAPLKLTDEDPAFMIELVRTSPGLFLDEMRERLYDGTSSLISITSLHRNLVEQMEITLKKANTVNNRKSLLNKYAFIEKMERIPAEFLVFTDESHFCSRDLMRGYSRAPIGEQADRAIMENNSKTFTLLPGISFFGVLALTVTDENVLGPNFEHFLKYRLLPRMNRYPAVNSILVLDNARIHGGSRVAELCKEAGVRLQYLPPYCPELNPIEFCFAKIKSILWRTQGLANSLDPEWEIERTTYRVVTEGLCQKLYQHAQYDCPKVNEQPEIPGSHFSENCLDQLI
ncbi:hypothetical protein MJO29_016678 [Puccinia striiformis f. sp. tritici]|nr:hypothetical protein MJO29_016678 [Puccinia striiformis f. sp. tritici]